MSSRRLIAADATSAESRLAAIGVAMPEHAAFCERLIVELMSTGQGLEARDIRIREAPQEISAREQSLGLRCGCRECAHPRSLRRGGR